MALVLVFIDDGLLDTLGMRKVMYASARSVPFGLLSMHCHRGADWCWSEFGRLYRATQASGQDEGNVRPVDSEAGVWVV